MQLDRVLIDALDWLRRILNWRDHKKVDRRPYTVLKSVRGHRGTVQLITRDTPRAVRTWRFVAFAQPEEGLQLTRVTAREYYICLDHLDAIRGAQRKPQRQTGLNVESHQVLVVRSSRFLTSDKLFDADVVFYGKFNFLRRDTASRDRWAIAAIDSIALLISNSDITDFNWETEIDIERKRYLGSSYR